MKKYQKATLAAGCFWGVQLKFSKVPRVISTVVGYTGGSTKNPTYKKVCTNKTGHAEAVQIKFDPKKVSYKKLLNIFWRLHNPTSMNRQGFNFGTQYRSAIFYHSQEQKDRAIISRKAYQKILGPNKVIITEITKATKFYPAEEYHQNYLKKQGRTTY